VNAQNGENGTKEAGTLFAVVPEVYFDIIARIAPGGTVLLLYFHECCSGVRLTSLQAFGIILFAYLIGITIDLAGSSIFCVLKKPFRRYRTILFEEKNKVWDGKWGWVRRHSWLKPAPWLTEQLGFIVKDIENVSGPNTRARKVLAEAVLCRSGVLFCIPSLFHPQNSIILLGKTYNYAAWPLIIVFLVGYANRGRALCKEFELTLKKEGISQFKKEGISQ